MSIQFSNSLQSPLKENEKNFISRKRIRKNEMSWSFEEEFLFFEAHTFLGNKWKRYSHILQK
jgi:hypothetical protein